MKSAIERQRYSRKRQNYRREGSHKCDTNGQYRHLKVTKRAILFWVDNRTEAQYGRHNTWLGIILRSLHKGSDKIFYGMAR
jgi:hypothetical protein